MKISFKQTLMTALIAGTALTSIGSAAHAGGFAVREQSAEGQGASFAGIAAGGTDLSSMFFNPATITLHEGIQVEGNAAGIIPFSKARNGATPVPGLGPSSGNIGKFALVPASYASYQVNDNLFIGFSANSPFGLVTKGNQAWAGSPHGVRSDLFDIQAGPTIGYKFNDMFSFGAAIRAVYSRVILTTLNPAVPTIVKAKGNDWSWNYSLGLTISPTDSTRIGVGYNSQTKLKYSGLLRAGGVVTAPITAKLTTPGTLTVGLRQRLGDKFTFLAGFEWADWSKLRQLQIVHKTFGVPLQTTPFNWKDSYFYSVGGEYAYSDDTTLRAGFAFEDSPVPNSTRGVRVPDANRYWLSIGASHRVNDKLNVSFGYSHIFANKGKVNLTAPVPLTATFKQHVDIIALSGTYKLDGLFQ